jgi:hypothetical protein
MIDTHHFRAETVCNELWRVGVFFKIMSRISKFRWNLDKWRWLQLFIQFKKSQDVLYFCLVLSKYCIGFICKQLLLQSIQCLHWIIHRNSQIALPLVLNSCYSLPIQNNNKVIDCKQNNKNSIVELFHWLAEVERCCRKRQTQKHESATWHCSSAIISEMELVTSTDSYLPSNSL